MRVFIVGGGITGLSAAWFLKKQHPSAHITLFEKEARLGGWIRTSQEGGYLFEKGPRTFPIGRSPHLLQLIEELNLEILPSSTQATAKYIWHQGRLRTPGSFLWTLWPVLLRETFLPPSLKEDESIYEFAARRFNPQVAETLFDPITLGVYAGDIRKLSMRACFPGIYQWEKERGSVLKGFFSAPKKPRGLFTLKGGMETLIHTLKQKLKMEIHLNCPAEILSSNEILAAGKTWEADRIINALPPPLPKKSLWVVNLVFAKDVLKKKGFGYLVPTQEKESVLGCVFDSSIFPQQNQGAETRLTVMLREEEQEPLTAALSALKRHLTILDAPVYSSVFLAKQAIPQMEVGCSFPHGLSLDACIQRAKVISA